MTAVLQSRGLGKRYRQRWALSDCTLSLPAGHVVGLVGPNGAGKTTLLHLATGLLRPTTGTIEVLGGLPAASPAQLASRDPLARREFLQSLMEFTAGHRVSVVMSSHLMADLERVCDYLILLVAGRVRVAAPVEELLGTHRLVTGVRCDPATWPADWQVISASHTDRQSTLLVRTSDPVHDPAWAVEQIGLEDLVLAYMS